MDTGRTRTDEDVVPGARVDCLPLLFISSWQEMTFIFKLCSQLCDFCRLQARSHCNPTVRKGVKVSTSEGQTSSQASGSQ